MAEGINFDQSGMFEGQRQLAEARATRETLDKARPDEVREQELE